MFLNIFPNKFVNLHFFFVEAMVLFDLAIIICYDKKPTMLSITKNSLAISEKPSV